MKVSAIVSAFHAAEYLEGRIENLLSQTSRPEIVVVCESGSEEDAIATRMLTDNVVRTGFVPTIYECWNIGIKAAHGEYITNANSDDRLAPGALEKLSRVLDACSDFAVVYPDVDIVEDLAGGFDGAKRTGAFRFAEGGFDRLMELCFIGPMPMWRRGLHEKHGYFDAHMQSAGDYEFWLRLAASGEKFLHVREPLGIYLDRPNSAGHRDPDLAASETEEARARYRPKRTMRYARIVT